MSVACGKLANFTNFNHISCLKENQTFLNFPYSATHIGQFGFWPNPRTITLDSKHKMVSPSLNSGLIESVGSQNSVVFKESINVTLLTNYES